MLVLLLVLVGCRDWRQLNGYRIIQNNDQKHFVVHETGRVVGPRVTRWGAFSKYLILYKVQEEEPVDKWFDRSGYFIINTYDGETIFAATTEAFKEIAVDHLNIQLSETALEPIYKDSKNEIYNTAR